MKKRYGFSVVLIALVAGFFAFKNIVQQSPVGQIAPVQMQSRPSGQTVSLNRIKSQAVKAHHSSLEDSSASEAAKIAEQQRFECHKKIDEQVANHPYLDLISPQLNSLVGEWYFRLDPMLIDYNQNPSRQEKFLRALAKSNLLAGIDVEQSSSQALKLLREVAHEDPENSAPLLFAAVIKQRAGDHQGAKRLIDQAKKTKYFKSYMTDFTRALYRSAETPADVLKAAGVWAGAPFPELTELAKLIENDEQLSNQLVQPGLKSKSNPQEMNFMLLEYAYGYANLKKMGKSKDMPTWKNLMKNEAEAADIVWQKVAERCDVSAFEGEAERFQKFFAEEAN